MEQLGSHWANFPEILNGVIFKKSVEKIKNSLISDKNNGYFTEAVCTFVIIYRSVLLRMRNVSDKCSTQIQNTYFMFNNFLSENGPFKK
jgi:hypothetical protein